MTVDYQASNWQTKKDVYALPQIDDLLYKLLHANFLSVINLDSGYHQIGLAPESCEKTVFVMPYVCLNIRYYHLDCAMHLVQSNI